jgi:hypothetical protein
MPHDESTPGLDTLTRELRAAAGQLRQYGRLAVSRLFGTVASTDGRYKAIVDLEERSLFTRAEMNAVARILLDKGVVTQAELTAAMVEEYRHLVAAVGKQWPELVVEEHAIHVKDLPAHAARARREGWPR